MLKTLGEDPGLTADYAHVLRGLADLRIGETPALDDDCVDRLHGLVEAVLSEATAVEATEPPPVVLMAANAALALAAAGYGDPPRLRLRAALLYELADKPMMAAAVIGDIVGPQILNEFFQRMGLFSSLSEELGEEAAHNGIRKGGPLLSALGQQAWELAQFQQNGTSGLHGPTSEALLRVALHVGLDLNASDVLAFSRVAQLRMGRATRSHVPDHLLKDLAYGGFPPELWSGQALALDAGLLDASFDAWSFSAPTGTGKTFLARLLILSTLRANAGKKVLYIVPSRALVRQVTTDLSKSLENFGMQVLSVTPQIVALDEEEEDSIGEADVLVLTPEKADLLIRLRAAVMDNVALVVIDEAHHIENGTRGVLLELYLWRLKHLAQEHARFVFMSAVAPNVGDLADWIGERPGGTTVTSRATGMRVGVFEHRAPAKFVEGWITYTDGTELRVIDKKADRVHTRGIPQLASALGRTGPVLVVARGKKTAENLAMAFVEALDPDADCRLDDNALKSPAIQRLDSRLEREMYSEVALRTFLKAGVAYHHAGLPPRVREAVEAAISDRLIKFVFATTTLAEGVNFPFSSVIVQALATRGQPVAGQATSWRLMTPRSFWNIAGRAGRAGFDYEGQVILYGPSLSLEKVDAIITPYLESSITAISPVQSALAQGIREVRFLVEGSKMDLDSLTAVELAAELPAPARGFINLVRIGIAHARASGLEASAEGFFDGTLAARELSSDLDSWKFGRDLVEQQAQVVDDYLAAPGAPPERLLAELGLSLDTLSRLREFVAEQEDWQIQQVLDGVSGGHLRPRSLKFFFSGVMARMAEPEGSRLGGGFYADLVVEWCRGIPFAGFSRGLDRGRLEDLINLMYTRIQFLLPWALYAVDRFFVEECGERGKQYDGQVRSVAYLVDAGVPNMAALRLTHVGFERADATRLAHEHASRPGAAATTNVMDWVAAQEDRSLAAIVRGADRRRLDYDFFTAVKTLRSGVGE